MNHRTAQQRIAQQVMQRLQEIGRLYHPARQGLARQINAGALQYRFLAVQRQCILVLGHGNVGQ